MDLEHQLDSKVEPASTPTPTSSPISDSSPADSPKPEPSHSGGGDEIEGISEHSDLNLPALLLWIGAVLALTAMISLWFLSHSAAQKLADKKSEKDATIAEISTPTYANVEAKATAFQAAVSQLKTASSGRYVFGDFLPLFYGRVNKNVVVTNLAVGSDGKLSFDGTTDSYKSAALQLASLQSWKINDKNVISNAQLLSESEDVSKGVVVKFAISANIDKTVSLKTTPTNTTPADSTSSPQGGN
ncbi:MAG: hypothetical protein Q7S80_02800 [bacterium]|nr:hypothetical protein [bacterium]